MTLGEKLITVMYRNSYERELPYKVIKKLVGKSLTVKMGTFTTTVMNSLRYDSPANPYTEIEISPANMDHCTNQFSHLAGLGRVIGGNWDLKSQLEQVNDDPIIKGIEQRFEYGMNWKDTDYFEFAKKRLSEPHPESFKRCKNLDELITKRCVYVDQLYKDIACNGYRGDVDSPLDNAIGTSTHDLHPVVLIGRNGEILFSGSGKHRFAIARVLNIKIPANVSVRHTQWQLIRDRLATSRPKQHFDPLHPDLQDL